MAALNPLLGECLPNIGVKNRKCSVSWKNTENGLYGTDYLLEDVI